MATDRVGIEISLMGYKEAMSQMQSLDGMVKGLNGRKNYVRIQAEIEKLRMNRDALKANKVKLQADMSDVNKKISAIKKQIKSLEGQKPLYKINSKAFTDLANRIGKLKMELRELEGRRLNIASNLEKTQSEINQTVSAMQRLQGAIRGVKSLSLPQIFSKASSSIGHFGSALQSTGYALNRLTAPMRMLTTGLAIGGVYTGVSKITEGLSSGFDRYDIMKKYPKVMEAFGYSNEVAQKSIDALDQSVRGLPTGLDEIVNVAQRFTATTGDIDKGTKLAIASNNAFLASMSTDTQKYQGMMQLQDVLGGKDMNAREWNSLVSSMTPAIYKMGESLGYTGKNMDEFIQTVRDGKMANEDFIDTLIKVGTEGGEVEKMAQQSKDTWQAFSANVKNAFSRMMYGVLTGMDELTQTVFGKDLNQVMSENVIKGIDKMTGSIKDWIKAHPEEIKEFFSDLKSIDWKGLGKGFLSGFGAIAKGVQSIAKALQGKDLTKLGKFLFDLNVLAAGFTIGGGLIKGGRFVFGGIAMALTGMARGLGALTAVLGGGALAKGIKNAKIITKLTGFFKKLKGLTTAAKAVGGASAAAGTAASAGGAAAAGAIFKGFLPAIEIIAGIGAVVTEITGIATLNTWIIRKGVDNLKAITSGINDVITNVNAIKTSSLKEGTLRGAVDAITSVYNILYGETGTSTRGANKAGTSMLGGSKGFGDMSPRKLKKSAKAVENMLGMFDMVSGIMDIIPTLVQKRENLNLDTFRNIFGGEKGLMAQFGAIAEDINKYMGKDTGITDVSASVDGMKATFTSVSEILKMIPNMTKSLTAIMGRGGGTGLGTSTLEQIKQKLTGENGFFSVIHSIMTAMNETMFGTADTRSGAVGAGSKGSVAGQRNAQALTTGGIGKLSKAMATIKTTFDGIKGIIEVMMSMQSSLAGLTTAGAQGSPITNITSQINSLMQGIGQIMTSINTNVGETGDIATKTDGLVTAVANIQSVVKKLNSLGKGGLSKGGSSPALGVIDSIKTMVTRLGQALNTETISTIQMQVSQFKAAVDEIFNTLNSDLSNVEVVVNINGRVTGHDKLISDINNARWNILKAVNRIPSTITKNVTVNVNPHVNVGKVNIPSASQLGGNNYRGGFITGKNGKTLYRSSGGSIFGSIFRPRGTDIVPAMLTPGEYVQRKEAVDTFGVRFMQKINNLDVAGAFKELSARMGSRVMGRHGTTIYNNITNNSPTINQTVNTRNPDFVFRRPSRYITAL